MKIRDPYIRANYERRISLQTRKVKSKKTYSRKLKHKKKIYE